MSGSSGRKVRPIRSPLRGFAGIAIATLVAAGCTQAQKDYLSYSASDRPLDASTRIARAMGQCWFAGDATFASYIYAPELNSYSGQPRILVLPKNEPGGLPRLVVQAQEDGRGAEVKLFGPLLATEAAPRIRADIARWSAGSSACTA
ncbi:hypothetical protein [Afifella aestuarii]|uniref:hypothetical protein n=1 Tax=Afifella aestuarii TaxID=1909496 RepID=UPI000FE37BFE|nr:hypothetical protein [Afifella aestuarii]